MTALDRYLYGNPMHILEQKQQREINRKAGMERVCMGCIYKRVILIGEEKHQACALKRGQPTLYCNHKKEAE